LKDGTKDRVVSERYGGKLLNQDRETLGRLVNPEHSEYNLQQES
jgi:hypothetical protein